MSGAKKPNMPSPAPHLAGFSTEHLAQGHKKIAVPSIKAPGLTPATPVMPSVKKQAAGGPEPMDDGV